MENFGPRMYKSSSNSQRPETFTLMLGFCKLRFNALHELYKNKEFFAVEQCDCEPSARSRCSCSFAVPLADLIMKTVNERRGVTFVSESSVLDPGKLLDNPQLFVLGLQRAKVHHELWNLILRALSSMRRSAKIGNLVNAACTYVPNKVADAWEQANNGEEGGLEPLNKLQLSDALSSAFVAALVRPRPVARQ
jgi:hypothetical protein